MIFGSVARRNQKQYTSNPSKEDLATGLVIAQWGHNMKRLLSPAVLKMAPARDYQPRVKSQKALQLAMALPSKHMPHRSMLRPLEAPHLIDRHS